MNIEEIVGMIPEDKRETVKGELAAYVKIDGRETAEKLMREHPALKSVADSWISKAVASHDERFMVEKLPGLVEAENAKKNPPKDPRDVKLAEMEKKLADMANETIREKQTARAIAKAAEKGLPSELARKFIGMTDDETDSAIEQLTGVLTPWRDEAIKGEVLKRLGNSGSPRAGVTPNALDEMKKQYVALNNAGRGVEATALWLRINEEEKKLNG